MNINDLKNQTEDQRNRTQILNYLYLERTNKQTDITIDQFKGLCKKRFNLLKEIEIS